MSARAVRRRLSVWADARASRRRQTVLMRISTTIICAAAAIMTVHAQDVTDVDRIFAEVAEVFGYALIAALAVEAGAGMRSAGYCQTGVSRAVFASGSSG